MLIYTCDDFQRSLGTIHNLLSVGGRFIGKCVCMGHQSYKFVKYTYFWGGGGKQF